MKKDLILLDDENQNTENNLVINKSFAEKYEKTKKAQELAKLREKFGNQPIGVSDSDESTSETEDEYGEEITPAVDVQMLKTIAAIRAKDPAVYDENKRFFDDQVLEQLDKDAREKNLVIGGSSEGGVKPYLIRDFHRDLLLKGEIPGELVDDGPKVKTHAEEQEELRQALKDAINTQHVDEDEEDELFKVREKTEEEKEADKVMYNKWLLENLKKDKASSVGLKEWIASQQGEHEIDENEKFLANFIFNRGWIDESQKTREADESIDEDEEFLSEAEKFEQQYNFRFEEIEALNGPGSSYSNLYGITTHAREVPGSVRRKDTARTEKRKERELRKQEEKQKQIEEIKRMKTLKRQEIEEMMEKIRKWGGMVDKEGEREAAVAQLVERMDAEEEFDGEKWDELMGDVFGKDYYDKEEVEKPVFSDDDEDYGEYEFSDSNVQVVEDQHGIEEDDTIQDQLNHCEQDRKPKLDKLELLKEQYDKLECEDIVAGIPCRFKYKPVDTDTFGLDADEILQADDQMLNEYISLKKLAPYRSSDFDKQWLARWKKGKKKRRKEFRKRLAAEIAELEKINEEDEPKDEPTEMKKKKKKRKSENEPTRPLGEKKKSRSKKTRLETYGL